VLELGVSGEIQKICSEKFDKAVRRICRLENGYLALSLGLGDIKIIEMKLEENMHFYAPEYTSKFRSKGKKSGMRLIDVLTFDTKLIVDNMKSFRNRVLISDYFWAIYILEFFPGRFPRIKVVAKASNMFCKIASV
jgi:hypothetical protein